MNVSRKINFAFQNFVTTFFLFLYLYIFFMYVIFWFCCWETPPVRWLILYSMYDELFCFHKCRDAKWCIFLFVTFLDYLLVHKKSINWQWLHYLLFRFFFISFQSKYLCYTMSSVCMFVGQNYVLLQFDLISHGKRRKVSL